MRAIRLHLNDGETLVLTADAQQADADKAVEARTIDRDPEDGAAFSTNSGRGSGKVGIRRRRDRGVQPPTLSSSTSKIRVASGGITPPAPREP
jgi:hypothetical protein